MGLEDLYKLSSRTCPTCDMELVGPHAWASHMKGHRTQESVIQFVKEFSGQDRKWVTLRNIRESLFISKSQTEGIIKKLLGEGVLEQDMTRAKRGTAILVRPRIDGV